MMNKPMKLWSVWCHPKDGSENGAWIGARHGKDRFYGCEDAAIKEFAFKKSRYPNWHYEVREYQDNP